MFKDLIHRLREQKPEWVNRRVSLFILTIIVFTMAMTWGEPIPQAAAMQISNIEQVPVTAIQQPAAAAVESGLSPELLVNREQTNGIIMGSVVLAFIIIGASLSAVYQKAHE